MKISETGNLEENKREILLKETERKLSEELEVVQRHNSERKLNKIVDMKRKWDSALQFFILRKT